MIQRRRHLHHHKVLRESLILGNHDHHHYRLLQDLYMVSTKELQVAELPLPVFREFHQNHRKRLDLVLDNYP
jgi:hypothetical protein